MLATAFQPPMPACASHPQPFALPPWQHFVVSHHLQPPHPSITLASVGLLTGQRIEATLTLAPKGSGLTFVWRDGLTLPATLAHVVNTQRGTTLGITHPATGHIRTLAIVEHYLAATCFAQLDDVTLTLPTSALELPLLEGSSWVWYHALLALRHAAGLPPVTAGFASPIYTLKQAVTLAKVEGFTAREGVSLALLPHPTGFKGAYTLNYSQTPALSGTTGTWALGDALPPLVAAQTFGLVAELPALQAKGFALGVSASNTLGLEDSGGFSRPLHHPTEPHLHKLLDFIGDFRLTGVNPLQVAMQVQATAAGHSAHVAMANHVMQAGLLVGN